MNKISLYIKDSFNELTQKVTWPSWTQLQSSTILVMVASLIFALVIFAMDISFKNVMTLIYNMLY